MLLHFKIPGSLSPTVYHNQFVLLRYISCVNFLLLPKTQLHLNKEYVQAMLLEQEFLYALLTTDLLGEACCYQPQSREGAQQVACIWGICWSGTLKVERIPCTSTAKEHKTLFATGLLKTYGSAKFKDMYNMSWYFSSIFPPMYPW